jgi:hypothetical protein
MSSVFFKLTNSSIFARLMPALRWVLKGSVQLKGEALGSDRPPLRKTHDGKKKKKEKKSKKGGRKAQKNQINPSLSL